MASEHLLSAALSLRRGGGSRVGPERIALLEAIGGLRSIRAAPAHVGLCYKAAWDAVHALNNLFETPLVTTHAGRRRGGAGQLTPARHAGVGPLPQGRNRTGRPA